MKGAKYVVTGLASLFFGILGTVGYMEYVTKPVQGYTADKDNDGIYDTYRIKDRRGKVTDINVSPDEIMVNGLIKKLTERKSSEPNDVTPSEPRKPAPKRRWNFGPRNGVAMTNS